jgi:streptogramin lyase
VQVDAEREPPILKSIAVPVPKINVPGVAVPTSAHSMVVGQGSVWTVRFRILFQVDPSRSELRERLTLESGISFAVNIAEGSDKIWIAHGGGLDQVNPATGEQREAVRSAPVQSVTNDVAVGGGFVWLGGSDGRLVRFDPQTNRKVERDGLDPIDAIAFGHGAVWTVDTVGGTVRAYDPDTMRPRAPIAMRGTDSLVAGEEGIWILDRSLGVLTRIDPSTGEVAGDAPVGPNPTGLTAGGGAIWVGDEDGVIRRVDEATRVVTDIPFGAKIRALAWDDETDTLWVDVL